MPGIATEGARFRISVHHTWFIGCAFEYYFNTIWQWQVLYRLDLIIYNCADFVNPCMQDRGYDRSVLHGCLSTQRLA